MLTRRSFLGLLSALPCLGWVKPEPIIDWFPQRVERPRLTVNRPIDEMFERQRVYNHRQSQMLDSAFPDR